jgi:hypothetical protein
VREKKLVTYNVPYSTEVLANQYVTSVAVPYGNVVPSFSPGLPRGRIGSVRYLSRHVIFAKIFDSTLVLASQHYWYGGVTVLLPGKVIWK